jgi:hypothetical protein
LRGHLAEFGVIAPQGLRNVGKLIAIVRDEGDRIWRAKCYRCWPAGLPHRALARERVVAQVEIARMLRALELRCTVGEVDASLDRTLPTIDNDARRRYVALGAPVHSIKTGIRASQQRRPTRSVAER